MLYTRSFRSQRKTRFLKVIFWIIFISGLYFAARIKLVWDAPNSDDSTRVSFTIEKGSSVQSISELLQEKELIRDRLVFRWYIEYHGLGNKLQAGEYIIPRNLTFEEMAEILQQGTTTEIKITIPEGSTIEQIDEILSRKNLITPGDFSHCAATCALPFDQSNLEGYLFPSTYFVNPKNFSSKNFIQRLYKNWLVKIDPYQEDIKASGRSLEEIVIVASLIEREAFGDSFDEKAEIAGIIWKRLDERIHLGIDATTRYEKNDWKNPLYSEDFESDSPYNTRRHLGLPPTAISNPGELSFKAALYPKSTPYYYYLHDKNGKIRFAETLEGHNINKQKYIW